MLCVEAFRGDCMKANVKELDENPLVKNSLILENYQEQQLLRFQGEDSSLSTENCTDSKQFSVQEILRSQIISCIQTSRISDFRWHSRMYVLDETSAYSNPVFQGWVAHRFFDFIITNWRLF